ncbi:MAG: T9SS type A sorting domain-containing protein [Flavobacterium sp.]|nr:T9SS type A sorting domain-containing protein [Flavobacterium sp.]
MKKIYLLLLLVAVPASNAQVINGDFENVKPNGKVSNWGINFSIPVGIDLGTGENTSDTILFGNSTGFSCAPTNDSYSGSKALEIRNAYNLTQNLVIPGGAVLFHDATQDSPGWNPGVPIEPGMNVSFLAFHYKYIPFGVTDVIEAELTVLGESGEIGRASIQIAEPDYVYDGNVQFKYAETPVIYTSDETPLWMYISFSMGTQENATFGTKIIIDDVRVNNGALSTTQFTNSNFAIFPTVTNQHLNVVLKNNNNDRTFKYRIYAIDGKLVREESVEFNGNSPISIDVSSLTEGVYFIKSKNGTAKFIRE